MAPEQMMGVSVDQRADQFSFCVSLYEALVGSRPFAGTSLVELHKEITRGKISAQSKKHMPRWLEEILRKGLSAQPEARFEKMSALMDAIRSGLSRRKRRRYVAGALALIVLAGGGGVSAALFGGGDSADPCADAGELGNAWSDARRTEVKNALLANKSAFAEETWRIVAKELDNYARQWKSATRASCLESLVYRTQDQEVYRRRLLCFEDLRKELDETTRYLVDGGEEVASTAGTLSQSLSRLSFCSPRVLLSEQRTPHDPDKAQVTRRLISQLKSAEREILVGKHEVGLTRIDELISEVEGLDHRPTEARSYRLRGQALAGLGNYQEASRAYQKAALAAEAGRLDSLLAKAVVDVYFIETVYLHSKDAAERWKERAHALVERAATDETALKLARVEGKILIEAGKLEEALGKLQIALELAEKLYGPEHTQVANTLASIGRIYMEKGDYEGAEIPYRKALWIMEKVRGGSHPDTGEAVHSLANALVRQAKFRDAQELDERAYSILSAAYDAGHPRVLAMVNSLSEYAYLEGDFKKASEMLEKVVAGKKKQHGERHPRVASSLMNLAMLHRAAREPSKSLGRAKEAYEILLQSLGPDAPQTIRSRLSLAEASLILGDGAAASSVCEEGMRSIRKRKELNPNLKARFASCLGRAEILLGNRRAAKRLLSESKKLFANQGDPGHLGLLYFALARGTEESDASKALAYRAYDLLTRAGPPYRYEFDSLVDWLRSRGLAPPAAALP
jgi:tetratricopeptide (TPR) repeat protein